jgi:hypothetical protein
MYDAHYIGMTPYRLSIVFNLIFNLVNKNLD